jgi:hypothetical protein
VLKAPNTNLQAPEKHQFAITNPRAREVISEFSFGKKPPPVKFHRGGLLEVDVWIFSGAWRLVLGI